MVGWGANCGHRGRSVDRLALAKRRARRDTTGMTPLSMFGLSALTLMLVFYTLERRSPWFILAFGLSCVLASVYGFLQGAWPFGVVEGIWFVVAVRRWLAARVQGRVTIDGL